MKIIDKTQKVILELTYLEAEKIHANLALLSPGVAVCHITGKESPVLTKTTEKLLDKLDEYLNT